MLYVVKSKIMNLLLTNSYHHRIKILFIVVSWELEFIETSDSFGVGIVFIEFNTFYVEVFDFSSFAL